MDFHMCQGSKLPWNENGWTIHFQWYGNDESLDPGTYDFQCFSYTTFQDDFHLQRRSARSACAIDQVAFANHLQDLHIDPPGWLHACNAPMIRQSDIWHLTWESQPTHANHRFLASIHAHLNQLRFRLASGRVTWRPWPLRITRLETIFRNGTVLQSCAGKAHCTVLDLKSRIQLNNTRYEKIRKDTNICKVMQSHTLRQPTYLLLISECMGLQLSNSWNQKLTCDIR